MVNCAVNYWYYLLLIVTSTCITLTHQKCRHTFDGFGVHLGQLKSFNKTTYDNSKAVLDHLYHDLGLRLYRTEYLSKFSPSDGVFSINCIDSETCSWIAMHSLISAYSDISLFVSIWSPPHYMKTRFHQLRQSYEWKYYYYLKNITALIKRDYDLDMGPISLINEPENVFAPWEHTVMSPRQLCRLIDTYKDPLISVCPENSYFWITKMYLLYNDLYTSCSSSCSIISTHGYLMNSNIFSPTRGTVYYDLGKNNHSYVKPIWMTEICSTLSNTKNSIQEAIDLGISIVNFVGHTCVTRYYYWLAFTTNPSGESLIWLTPEEPKGKSANNRRSLFFPKKYFAFKHFSLAAFPTGRKVTLCSTADFHCLAFDDNVVYINDKSDQSFNLGRPIPLCCTTGQSDWSCGQFKGLLPPKSICSVSLNNFNVPFNLQSQFIL